ncbi:MAG: hypothetical protein EXR35_00810 [Limnohabitans sp.]|nr:hypothetical protein [Limnohabitans sp.]
MFVNLHISKEIVNEQGFVGSDRSAAKGKGFFNKETDVAKIGFDDNHRVTSRTVYRVDSKSPEQLIKTGGMISLGGENGNTCMKNHTFGVLLKSNLISASTSVCGTMIRGNMLNGKKYLYEIQAKETDAFHVSGDISLVVSEA